MGIAEDGTPGAAPRQVSSRSRLLLLALTGSRLVFAAGFAVAALAGINWPLLPLALLAELSDVTDGPFARRTGQSSLLGNIYDGTADHLTRMTEFISLSALGVVGFFPVLVFLWRDAVVIATQLVSAVVGAEVPTTRLSAKLKGLAQGGCIAWLSATLTFPALGRATGSGLSSFAIGITVAVTVVSGFDYVRAHWPRAAPA